MKNVQVEFNTRTFGIKSSTEELRRRWIKSPGFQRLLKKAANDKLRGRPVTLKASNQKALRALEQAVYKVGVREFEITLPEGVGARAVYLMKDGKAWTQVGKRAAVKAQKATTPDTLAVMPLWVYSPRISWAAARRLDAKTAPESINSMLEEVAPVEFSENRSRDTDRRGDTAQTEGRELSPWEEESAEYNDAGELETRAERAEREQEEHEAKEKQGVRIARERAAAAGKVFIPPTPRRTPKATPRYFEYMHVWERTQIPAPTPAVTPDLPAAPWYHATEDAMQKVNRAEWEILCDERDAHQQRRAALDDDHNEQLECAELDELLSGEDLEADMMEPWEAMERFAAAQ